MVLYVLWNVVYISFVFCLRFVMVVNLHCVMHFDEVKMKGCTCKGELSIMEVFVYEQK